jgi:DNA-binding NarL/FixJ family response regulator
MAHCDLYYCPCGCGIVMRPLVPVTPVEIEVLRAYWQGKGTKTISEERFRSIKTIESHRRNLLLKAGLGTRIENMSLLYQWGLKKGYIQP